MNDDFHPSVDISFIEEKICDSGKVIPESRKVVGDMIYYVLAVKKPMHKRIVIISQTDTGVVNFEQAMSFAIRFSFIGLLLSWLENNKQWKEGAYINPPVELSINKM